MKKNSEMAEIIPWFLFVFTLEAFTAKLMKEGI